MELQMPRDDDEDLLFKWVWPVGAGTRTDAPATDARRTHATCAPMMDAARDPVFSRACLSPYELAT